MKQDIQKVTVNIPSDLLAGAQAATGKGITETICGGLEAIRRAEVYKGISTLKGKVKFKYTWQELRTMDDEA